MLESMEQLIRRLDLIPPGSAVLCAVSGGADSVCLLHALYRLRPRLGFSLAAAHYDHQLRGEESRRDAAFVEQFVALCCGAQRLPDGRVLPPVPLFLGSGDVAGQARARGTGLEETARDMRYAFLRQAAREAGADRIATAHTADDNAETLLLHLARGTGLRGLGGIPPARGALIRPLLSTSRQEVEDYLAYYALPHMEDSSNASDDFARNRIRHQVIPVLEELFPGFLARTGESMSLLRADEDCLTGLARALADQASPVEGGLSLEAEDLFAPGPVRLLPLAEGLHRQPGGGRSRRALGAEQPPALLLPQKAPVGQRQQAGLALQGNGLIDRGGLAPEAAVQVPPADHSGVGVLVPQNKGPLVLQNALRLDMDGPARLQQQLRLQLPQGAVGRPGAPLRPHPQGQDYGGGQSQVADDLPPAAQPGQVNRSHGVPSFQETGRDSPAPSQS